MSTVGLGISLSVKRFSRYLFLANLPTLHRSGSLGTLPSQREDRRRVSTGNMLSAPAADRNKQPIFDVLSKYLPKKGTVLEIASGTGQHVAFFAPQFPDVIWQPSDVDSSHLTSISAHIKTNSLRNVRQPLLLDITEPMTSWAPPDLPPGSCDLVYNANMVHISPWDTAVGLFKTAGRILKPGGLLFMYGPFRINGVLAPESNVNFDKSLRARDSSWGVRDVADLDKLAKENGLKRTAMVDMPSNNKSLIFEKDS